MKNKSNFLKPLGAMLKLGALAVLVLLLSACGGNHPEEPTSSGVDLPTIKVETRAATGESVVSQVQVTGVVKPIDKATIATKVMGTIRQMPFALGKSVNAGELLVEIEAAEIKAKVTQAEAQFAQAKRDLAREESLLEKGASTPEMVKNLRDRVAITEAMLEEALVMRGYTEIRAPFDGTVAKKFTDVGSLASPGMPILEFVGESGYEIEAGVPESLASDLLIGARFRATLPSKGEVFEVTLAEISLSSDSYSRTVTAKFTIPSGIVTRTGQFAKVGLSGSSFKAILVPMTSVSKVGQMERLFVVDGGLARMRLVKTGETHGELIEILSGVDVGESVIATAGGRLVDGQPVETVQQ